MDRRCQSLPDLPVSVRLRRFGLSISAISDYFACQLSTMCGPIGVIDLSGSHGTVPKRMKMKMNCSTSGILQATPPPAKEKAKVIQFESMKPKIFMIISMMMSLPLQDAFDVSPCQTGAVAVLTPLPMPATILYDTSVQRSQVRTSLLTVRRSSEVHRML